MHGDNRNYNNRVKNSSAQRASGTPHNNTGTVPKANNQGGTSTPRPSANTRPVTQNGVNGRTQNTPNRQMRQTPNGSRQPQGNRSKASSAPQKDGMIKRTRAWLKKNYTVDKEAAAEREAVRLSLVREKGSIDYVFFILVILLLTFGTVMVYSASYVFSKTEYGDSYHIIFRQIIFIAVGFIGMAVAANVPPEWFKRLSLAYFVVCFVMMMIVPIPIPGFTVVHNGARRWINLGFIEIQPSEFMKLGLVMMLSFYFDSFYERIVPPASKKLRNWYGVITPLAITGAVCALVLIEKHLSGTVIMVAIGVMLIIISGAPSKWMIPGGIGIGAIFAALIAFLPHARRRFEIWRNPWLDPQNAGYQTLQGLYAIGSGGLFGVGLGNSYQKHMFVSMPHNDFIFVIVCEELGFIGAVGVIILFALLVWRGFVISMNAPDIYSQLLTVGIIGKIAVQAVLNIAVVTNSIPNTGISLPFFSYGGSSLIVLMVEMGMVMSISRYSKHKK